MPTHTLSLSLPHTLIHVCMTYLQSYKILSHVYRKILRETFSYHPLNYHLMVCVHPCMCVCVCACVRMCVFACMNVCMEWSVFIYFLCSEFAESTFRYDRILHCTGFKVQKENTCVIPTMYNIRPPLMYSLISPSSMNQ